VNYAATPIFQHNAEQAAQNCSAIVLTGTSPDLSSARTVLRSLALNLRGPGAAARANRVRRQAPQFSALSVERAWGDAAHNDGHGAGAFPPPRWRGGAALLEPRPRLSPAVRRVVLAAERGGIDAAGNDGHSVGRPAATTQGC
jgi:hypothetical protein